jgi:hypothetical protein
VVGFVLVIWAKSLRVWATTIRFTSNKQRDRHNSRSPAVALAFAQLECLLRVKSRHRSTSAQCPLYAQKRTLRNAEGMSALCQ